MAKFKVTTPIKTAKYKHLKGGEVARDFLIGD